MRELTTELPKFVSILMTTVEEFIERGEDNPVIVINYKDKANFRVLPNAILVWPGYPQAKKPNENLVGLLYGVPVYTNGKVPIGRSLVMTKEKYEIEFELKSDWLKFNLKI